MDGTYFVPRGELLLWLNTLCQTNVLKIEELATGAVYCQIFDECMPGNIQMSKVNWNAKNDYEYIKNFKILQQGFLKCGVKKEIEVERLIRGKCQDNLEMLQWMKKFFDNHYPGTDRKGSTPAPRMKTPRERTSVEKIRPKEEGESKINQKVCNDKGKKNDSSPVIKPIKAIDINEKQQAINSKKIAMDIIQKERDFYFEKLREIELEIQQYSNQDSELVKKIQAILYSEDT